MASKRVVFVGGGSIQFAPSLLADLTLTDGPLDWTLVLHDIDPERLELIHGLAQRWLPRSRRRIVLEATTDPRAALAAADAVIVSIELDRFETWDLDRSIPLGLGVPQALGENGGPGGLFHALRMIPGAIALGRTIEELCPNALVLNLSNPMSRMCLALASETKVRLVGLCHEIHAGRKYVAEVVGIPDAELQVEASGLNHFTWFTKLEDSAGRDLYPRVRELMKSEPSCVVRDDRLLTSEILRLTGVLCVTNDSHAGEYVRFGHSPSCRATPDLRPMPFYEEYRRDVAAIETKVRKELAEKSQGESIQEPSGEEVIPMLDRVFADNSFSSDAINVRNDGLISDLPGWAIVEVPGEVSARGGIGRRTKTLPDWVLAACSVQARIHKLTVRAAIHGDRQAALEALLIDPSVPSPAHAERVFAALLEAHRKYLPAFEIG